MERIPIRHYSRICIPGVFVSRGIRALLRPLELVGPEIAGRLERRSDLLDDISCPSRLQRAQHRLIDWLLEAPRTEPLPTEALPATPARQRAENAFRAAFPPEGPGPFLTGPSTSQDNLTSPPQVCSEAGPAGPASGSKGVR